jgi:1,4-alpha-glucan branching enzyme
MSKAPRRLSSKKTVSFEYFDPAARIVTVAGDFNGWDPRAKPLKRDAGGLWTVSVRLEPGIYRYKFVVNGEQWEEDPLNLHRVLNEHGTYNSIRKVGAIPSSGLERERDGTR